MYYCQNCNNIYDITKNIQETQSGGDIEDTDSTSSDMSGGAQNYDKLIDKIINNELIDENDVLNVRVSKLMKDQTYKKLTPKEKEKIINIIEEKKPTKHKHVLQTSDSTISKGDVAYFICNNCKYYKPIESGTLIYSKKSNTTTQKSSVEISTNKKYSKILPLTRKYNCPNDKCDTHNNPELKEAVIFRTPNTYITKYLCKHCSTEWL